MKRLLILGTFLITASLLVGGLYFPNAAPMWLASTSEGFAVIRGGILILLGALLWIEPPRPLYLRIVTGATAVALMATVLWMTAVYMLQPIDTVVLVEVAIVFGIEALEGAALTTAASKRTVA